MKQLNNIILIFMREIFYLCVKKNKCKKIILTEKKVKKLLGQRLYIDSKVFFLGDSKIKNFFVYPRSWKLKIFRILRYYIQQKIL